MQWNRIPSSDTLLALTLSHNFGNDSSVSGSLVSALVPLQAGCEFGQGLQEVWGSSWGLLAEALPSPAQLSLLNVTILNLSEQLRHHLTHKQSHKFTSVTVFLKGYGYVFRSTDTVKASKWYAHHYTTASYCTVSNIKAQLNSLNLESWSKNS